MNPSPRRTDPEEAVLDRYARGAREREDALCCPVDYDRRLLDALPPEIVERDYGCGDPSRDLRAGETVLDLGSGGGKICYMAAQIVGPAGRVIGVDMNDEMLSLARRHRDDVARRIGHDVVEFRRGRIQDLRSDLDATDAYLRVHPVTSTADLAELERFREEQRRLRPLVGDEAIDVVISNCVLNLVRDGDKRALFDEIFRVLRRGGRAVVSDIVCDEPVPDELKLDPELWSGCLSGAFQESAFLQAFEAAGFHGIEIVRRDDKPWRTVEGIEFRSVTVRAFKGKQGPCWDHNQAVVYRGPWSEVRDDDGHVLRRGVPMAVCEKTFRLYSSEPYAGQVIAIEPRIPIAPETAKPFDCTRDAVRSARETKGIEYRATETSNGAGCEPGACC